MADYTRVMLIIKICYNVFCGWICEILWLSERILPVFAMCCKLKLAFYLRVHSFVELSSQIANYVCYFKSEFSILNHFAAFKIKTTKDEFLFTAIDYFFAKFAYGNYEHWKNWILSGLNFVLFRFIILAHAQLSRISFAWEILDLAISLKASANWRHSPGLKPRSLSHSVATLSWWGSRLWLSKKFIVSFQCCSEYSRLWKFPLA